MKREPKVLSDARIKKIKKILLKEQEKLTMKDKGQENFCLDKNELSDTLDEANMNIQTQQMLRFRNREIFYLKKINQALDAIECKTYGLCEECSEKINYERLLARPTANLCISCKEESEFIEKNNIYQKRSKSLGKTLMEIGRR
ncbi:MAG: TraR/DksA family transcriptional regulator [Bdellovibrionales bacterium]|jgi:DnaK suppressor protein|nr:TraR/DksA family transcriptional regulator [Bdellovibrionales bacterium]MBT3526785.1 TraR/DksA family transcriptional regulator [Bdellovibrionales bacterium]MBT7668344.1 TraR/DksA family transcriptional regulator [Bdellovibrionales bacterium]MBT7766910.1 TraR/DksA family transcriptional regulator [Bdellovibrionales bacterium]